MSDLVGNPLDLFSRVAAHMKVKSNGVYISWTSYPDVAMVGITGALCLTEQLRSYGDKTFV